jgi:acetoin utilization deacetylase AcuC-like enzyme
VDHIVGPIAREYSPDLILISAGYDAHRDDPIGGLRLETSSFGALAGRMRALGDELSAPVGAVLEGGYELNALANSVAETMAALANGGAAPPEPAERHPLTDQAAAVLAPYWKL